MIQEKCLFECFDLCFFISTFLVPFLSFLIIRLLRPRMRIELIGFSRNQIKIAVNNSSFISDIHTIQIEICIIEKIGSRYFTYHVKADHSDFLILPCSGIFSKRDSQKIFICTELSESVLRNGTEFLVGNAADDLFEEVLLKVQNGGKLRVRCHGTHAFSGLGRAVEKQFTKEEIYR